MCDVRQPTVPTRDVDTPSVPASTTNCVMPRLPASGSVFAATTMKSAIVPFVMKVFWPVRTQSSPSRTAFVVMPPTSEPAFGSVTASAPIFSPLIAGTSHRRRCSSVPNRYT